MVVLNTAGFDDISRRDVLVAVQATIDANQLACHLDYH